MNNACSYTLLMVAFLTPFSLQAMKKKEPGKLKIPALFIQDDAKPAKNPETPHEIPAQHRAECEQLMDAYTHKKKSVYYDPQYKSPYYIGGKLLLEALLHNKDTQAWVQLIASGTLEHTIATDDLFYDALRNNYYPLCHLLLTNGQADAQLWEQKRKTPLYWLLAHSSGIHPHDLLLLCNLLRQHGADITKPLKDGRYIYESLAANLQLQSFYTIFPTLKQLGLSPELPDDQGFTPVHRLARCKDVTIWSLMNLVIPWQVSLEQKIPLTVLLINRYRRQSLLGQVPKDVILKHIMPYVCPFRHRMIQEAANQQLALLQRLLIIKTNLQFTPQDIFENCGRIVCGDYELIETNRYLLVPDKVAQHRAAFMDATKKLMAAFDAPRE